MVGSSSFPQLFSSETSHTEAHVVCLPIYFTYVGFYDTQYKDREKPDCRGRLRSGS